ncbi:LytR family transcriptional attenuator [Antricoccus suffuscus]|uniref:LytR family transcriptional attenuator n=1 Tax=Antricoccus suffuscus TaxID=1629062 RepID=A0A2T0ZWL2_9ACTN|nr:LCP family protein [Antricoccus suffuscus]PRZ40736.1 LytR family transcriptional attenuator [Antricoccus suffuscus]
MVASGEEDGPELPAHLDPRTTDQRTTRAGRRHHQSRAKRLAINALRAFAGVLAVAILVASGAAHSLYTTVSAKSGNLPAVDAGTHNADASGVNGEDLNIMVVGDDSRDGYTPEQLAELSTQDDGGGQNTDTIMLIHVPANGKSATVVSFPRDSYVSIPGQGMGRINSAYADGYASVDGTDADKSAAGQKLLIETVSQLAGVQIDGYVEVRLLGVVELTDELGGIEVNLCQAAKDPYSGTDLPAGKSVLDGKQALSFVRQRHGLDDFGGDLARVQRQQYFFGSVIRKILSANLLDFGKVTGLVSALSGTIHYSSGLDPITLAKQMQDIAAGAVKFATIPLAPEKFGKVDGQDIVVTQTPDQIRQFMIDLNKDPATPPSSESSAPSPAPSNPSTGGDASAPAGSEPATPTTTAADTGCIN